MLFRYFYGRPLMLAMVLLIGSLLGTVGYLKLPRNMFPDVERSQVTIITQLPGASAQTVAQKVSRPIEQEMYALAGIRNVQSTNKNEVSIVRVEFEYGKVLNIAALDVNSAMSRVRGKLPPESPVSAVYSVGSFISPVLTLALSPKPGSQVSLAQVRLIAENDLRTAFLTQPNIASVEVFGGHEPAVRIDFDPLKLASFRISQAQLQDFMVRLGRDYPVGTAPRRCRSEHLDGLWRARQRGVSAPPATGRRADIGRCGAGRTGPGRAIFGVSWQRQAGDCHRHSTRTG
jgi:multidrug efflux pump subunit AcrB